MNKKTIIFTLLIFLLAVTAACSGGEETTPTPSATATIPATEEVVNTEPVQGLAPVDSVQVLLMESFPVQVSVRARGELPDGCTEIEDTVTTQNGNNFEVKITTLRQPDATCTEALVPFDENISLDVEGLEAGTYTVTVNGISGSFTLEVDNVAQEEPVEEPAEPTAEPTTEAVAPTTAVVSGLVWHDVCTTTGQPATDAVAEAGCVGGEDGTFQADGQLGADEIGIEGATIDLGEGACPAIGLATAVTDADGNYTFTDLSAGIYCVSLNPINEANSALLETGVRTFPFDPNGHTLTIEGDANDINFGWDYEFLPLPTATEDCTNSITFVEDLSIPDDTQFAPEEEFTKSWRIRNSGTCPWTTEYTLIYLGGDDIPGPTSVPLPKSVAPGQPVDVNVTFTAPTELGTYREDWIMRDANGAAFGVDGFPDEPIWLQIVVAELGEPTPTAEPNSGTIGGVIWRDYCTIFNDGSAWRGCVEIGEDSGFFVADGTYTANEVPLTGLDVILGQGACSAEGTIPTTILATATTDDAGLYRFEGLGSGTYCVFINAFSNNNVELLIPGNWTWPGLGIGYQTFILDEGEQALAIDFGWDDYDD